MRSFLFLLISAASVAAQAAPPPRLEITYEIARNGTVLGDIVQQLQHGNGRYSLDESWKGRGLFALRGDVHRTSRGSVLAQGLRPDEFVDERSGRPRESAVFDWAAGTLAATEKGRTRSMPMQPNAQDRLSFMLGFAFAPPGAGPMTFHLADGDGFSRYVFEVVGKERLKTPAGEFDTVRLARRQEGPKRKRMVDLWLAPRLGYVPVRMLVVEKDGERLDQRATRISSP